MRVAIYARLSRNDGASTSIARQVADCRSRFRPDWQEVAVYEDDDLSAWNVRVQRPAYERMLTDIDKGRIDLIIARALDRLLRHPREWERLWERCERARVNIVTVHEGVDTTTTFGREFVPRMLAIFAKMESDNISARVRSKHDELRRQGRWSGGRRAFGLNQDWTEVVPEEAEAIQEAAQRILDGASLNSIVRNWNERGLLTRTGKPWDASSVKRLLLSPRMVGRRRVGTELSAIGIPAVLDEETWRQVGIILNDPSRKRRGPPKTHLLSGLVRCGLCGSRMYPDVVAKSQAQRKGAVRYACRANKKGCGKVSIRAERTEEAVMRLWVEYSSTPQFRDAVARLMSDGPQVDRQAIEAAIKVDKERLYGLMDRYTAGELTEAEWERGRWVLVARIEERERQLAERKDIDPDLKRLMVEGPPNFYARQWRIWPLEVKRSVLGFAWKRIDILPARKVGRRFDPDRIRPVPHDLSRST